mmetsp:Transcript_66053/g.137648  ORF Transcript_66053/g.137648 Transcript_66053/m.137648 type:complete len:112 (-) Transcript_66053:704-1039(-)
MTVATRRTKSTESPFISGMSRTLFSLRFLVFVTEPCVAELAREETVEVDPKLELESARHLRATVGSTVTESSDVTEDAGEILQPIIGWPIIAVDRLLYLLIFSFERVELSA